MKFERKFNQIDLYVAQILAVVWFGASVFILLLCLWSREWLFLVFVPFALWYGMIWVRVARTRRQLTLREALRPWRDIE